MRQIERGHNNQMKQEASARRQFEKSQNSKPLCKGSLARPAKKGRVATSLTCAPVGGAGAQRRCEGRRRRQRGQPRGHLQPRGGRGAIQFAPAVSHRGETDVRDARRTVRYWMTDAHYQTSRVPVALYVTVRFF